MPTTTGGLAIAFGGIHSTNSADPLIGLIGATHNADGTWSAPTTIATGGGTGSIWSGVLSGGVPIFAGDSAGSVSILVNPTSAASKVTTDLLPQLGPGTDGYQVKLALDSMGRLWVAWYTLGPTGHTGLFVQQLDQTTGLPIGTPTLAPNSENIDNNSFGTALTCAVSCRLVYGDAPAGTSTNLVVSWWIGQATPTTIANLANTGQTAGRVVAAAYRSDGRLWIAWYNGKTYSYVLGDGTGAGGVVQDAGAPSTANGAYALSIAPVGDNLLMGVNFNYKAGQNIFAVFVNDVAPPAPVTFAPGPRQSTVEATPGGKGFRIQVQYRVPSICKPSCTAHAEIRTRSGRTAVRGLGDGAAAGRRQGGARDARLGEAPGRQEGALLHDDQQGAAPQGAVLDGRREPRREHAAARLPEDEERGGAHGARRPHRRVDRPHQVGGAPGSVGDPVGVGPGGSTPAQYPTSSSRR